LLKNLALPPVKIHCSVLAEDAIKAAINDFRVKNGLEPIESEKVHH
jgi:nitrogen fixation NifU-like protein